MGYFGFFPQYYRITVLQNHRITVSQSTNSQNNNLTDSSFLKIFLEKSAISISAV